jgi:ribosomal protein S18 acetylase RimI-like enzyme
MTEVDIEIRDGLSSDAEVLANIGATSFTQAYGSHSNDADLESHISNYFNSSFVRDEIEQQNCRYLLSTVNGSPAGIAKFRPAPCPVADGEQNAIELQQLYVLADMQGYGLGRRLVACLIDAARHTNANGIWLSAWQFADWATGFYRNIGFREIGKVDFRLGETIHTDLLMWMSLE